MTDVTVSDSLYSKSPLDALVRRSSHRTRHSPQLQPPTHPDRGHSGTSALDPPSPLLHTRFRTSTATAISSDNSFVDYQDDTITSRDTQWSRDDESIYSSVADSSGYSPGYETPNFAYVLDTVGDQSPTLPPSPTPSSPSTMPEHDRDSWASQSSEGTVRGVNRDHADTAHDTWRRSSGDIDPFTFQSYDASRRAPVPTVVVSSPVIPNPSHSNISPTQSSIRSHSSAVAHPIATQYSVLNFSRPIRPPTVHDEESKREVLDRNRSLQLSSTTATTASPRHGQRVGYSSPDRHADSSSHQPYQQSLSHPNLHSSQDRLEYPESGSTESHTPAIFRSSSTNAIVSNSQTTNQILHPSSNLNVGRSASASAVANLSSGHIRLPNSPPSPTRASRASLYSTYSFYQLEDGSRSSSPASTHFPAPEISNNNLDSDHSKVTPTRSKSRKSPAPTPSVNSSTTPDEYLALGIQHHEANRLAESATCFERAATVDGGCGVGMLMWGLSLRHAWGTEKDEKAGFRWLRKAAEAAVGDLEAAREGVDQKAVKTELILAIYEVGQCFFHGWGVPQDKKMAVSYFQVAARLGDGDAQQELGYCFANGKGCKKDLKEAAKWYRAAAAQGASTVGLAWIYKPKYS